jgi:CRISPR/Cas system-associated protein Cas5 (RAMP superfamily)
VFTNKFSGTNGSDELEETNKNIRNFKKTSNLEQYTIIIHDVVDDNIYNIIKVEFPRNLIYILSCNIIYKFAHAIINGD